MLTLTVPALLLEEEEEEPSCARSPPPAAPGLASSSATTSVFRLPSFAPAEAPGLPGEVEAEEREGPSPAPPDDADGFGEGGESPGALPFPSLVRPTGDATVAAGSEGCGVSLFSLFSPSCTMNYNIERVQKLQFFFFKKARCKINE